MKNLQPIKKLKYKYGYLLLSIFLAIFLLSLFFSMENSMTIDHLLEAAKNIVITPEDIKALNERLKAAEEKFEREAWERRITTEFLNRTYTL